MFIVVGPDRPIDLNAAPRPERVSRVHSGMVPTTTMGGISTLGTLDHLERRLRSEQRGSKKPQSSIMIVLQHTLTE